MKLLIYREVEEKINAIASHPHASQLFFGPNNVGKALLARELARMLGCKGCEGQSCRSCMMALAGNHPDIHIVQPDEKGKIGIDAIQSLQRQLSLTKYHLEGVRTVIIEDADTMTISAQNALLKTLEEPPAGALIILTAYDKAALLVTIQSRCQSTYIAYQSLDKIASYLQTHHNASAEEANKAADFSAGAIGLAIKYIDSPEHLQARVQLEDLINGLVSHNIFSRLLAAGDLAQVKINELILTQVLIRRLKDKGQLSASTIGQNLKAVESFRKRIASNTNQKTALEALAVELEC